MIEQERILDGLSTVTQYEYRNDKIHINPTEIRVYRNGSLLQETNNYYVQDIIDNNLTDGELTINLLNEMTTRNMVNVTVQSESSGLETKGVKNIMKIIGNRILPWKQYAKERDLWVEQSELIYTNNDQFPDLSKLKSYEKNFRMNWYTPFSAYNGGLLESQTYLDDISSVADHQVSFTYHDDRRLSSRTEIDNQSVRYTFDGFKRLDTIEVTGAMGGVKSITRNTYNVDFTGEDNYVQSDIQFPDNKYLITKNSYLPSGLLDKTTRLLYGPDLENVVTDDYQYDEFKRLTTSVNYQTGETNFTYYPDPLNRLHTRTYSDGSVTTLEYGSFQGLLNTEKIIDENGNESVSYSDLLSRPVYNDRLLNGQIVRTSYDYYDFGALENVTTPKGENYEYTYDDNGRLLTKKIPGQSNVIGYTYDPFYRIETMTDANGIVQTYDYDVHNRNTKTYVDGTEISENFYDKDGTAGIYLGKIHKTVKKTMENNSYGDQLTTDFEYDEFGRTELEDAENHIGGNDIVDYTYDYMDNILTANKTHTGYSSTISINSTFTYDHSFRMETEDIKVNNEPTVRLQRNIYNIKDQLEATWMYGRNSSVLQIVNYDYNGRGWLTKINEVDDNGIPLVGCKGGDNEPCKNCTKNYTAEKSVTSSGSFVIVDVYGGGGKLIPLEYPYRSDQLSLFKDDLKQWLTENEFSFEEIDVTWENGLFQVSALQSVFELNSINISDAYANKSEMLFALPNAEEFIENENEYCNLCQQFGYDCATCPVWELLEACPSCPVLDEEVMVSLDCDNCDIGGYGILPKQLTLKLNPELFVASDDQIIHWDAATVLYLKDGEGIGFHPAGTYLAGNPFNVSADQSDVYISFQLPQIIIAKDNQLELEEFISRKLSEELKSLFVGTGDYSEPLETRLQALSTEVSREMMDRLSPFAKEESDKINRADVIPGPGEIPPIYDLFKMSLNYQEGHAVSGGQPQYNGNISGMTWQTGNERKRTYGFSYDNLDRLKIARYADWQIDNRWSSDEKFSTGYGYDSDGNFTSILRNGAISPCSRFDQSIYNYGRIDQLGFIYNNQNQNQLQEVNDGSLTNQGFKNGNATYSYDAMGSLTTDSGKNMTVMNNFLNLPSSITLDEGELVMKYLVTGEKLRKTTASNTGLTTTIDYCGNIEYENETLAAIHHTTGRIIPLEDRKRPFRYQFHLTDHLGNVRIMFEDKDQSGSITKRNPVGSKKRPYIIDEEEIVVINHYYPFGLKMGGPVSNPWYSGENGRKYDYSYNGKELNEDFGLDWSDYGARWYDATIGRWGAVDPLATKYTNISPYVYVANNPILNIDPDGRYYVGINGKKVKIRKRKGQLVIKGDNASKDLKTLISSINSSGSKTAIKQIKKASRNKTKIHVKIENNVIDNGLYGLHQAHDNNGDALEWNSKKGDFDGIPAYEKKGVYKEATITVFKGNIDDSMFSNAFLEGFETITNEQEMANTFQHESQHDTDKEFIKDLKNKRDGKRHEGIDPHQNITPQEEKVYREMERHNQKKKGN